MVFVVFFHNGLYNIGCLFAQPPTGESRLSTLCFMRPIPVKMRQELAELPRMHICERKNHECKGRITWEHAFCYGASQINEKFAIIGLCEYHHLGKGLNKEINQWISVNLMTNDDIRRYPKKNWAQIKKYLNGKYGAR